MEYRIEASVVLEPNHVAGLIMAWYRGPVARRTTNASTFRPHSGQAPGNSTSQRFGTFTFGANVRPGSLTGATAAERAGTSISQRYSGKEASSTFPVSTQPAVIRSETNFAIAPGIQLQKVSGLGDFKLDYFFWQNNQVLVLERLSGRHYWVRLKDGWNNPQVANPPPANLGRFNPDVPFRIPVSQMTDTEKLAEAARLAGPLIIERAGEAIREQVESLTDPETIATMLAIVSVSVLCPIVGIGFAILGAYYLGDDAIKVLENLISFVRKATKADTDTDLKEAAQNLAEAVVTGGVVAWELLSKKRGKGRKLVKKQPSADAKATPVYKEPGVETEKPAKKKEERKTTTHRLPKFRVKPPFTKNPNHSQTEFDRQMRGQENGLNELTVEEYLNNRDTYLKRQQETGSGRTTAGNKAQERARQEALRHKRAELLTDNPDMTTKQAETKAAEWLKTQNALHDPDQIVGGHPDKISGLGDAGVNKSIGSQWGKGRADALDEYVRRRAEGMTAEERRTTKLDIQLTDF